MDERILDNVMPQSSVSAALSASVESSKEYDPSLSGSFDLASSGKYFFICIKCTKFIDLIRKIHLGWIIMKIVLIITVC